jgi:hypothetical protein
MLLTLIEFTAQGTRLLFWNIQAINPKSWPEMLLTPKEFTVQGSRLRFWKIQAINPKP